METWIKLPIPSSSYFALFTGGFQGFAWEPPDFHRGTYGSCGISQFGHGYDSVVAKSCSTWMVFFPYESWDKPRKTTGFRNQPPDVCFIELTSKLVLKKTAVTKARAQRLRLDGPADGLRQCAAVAKSPPCAAR